MMTVPHLDTQSGSRPDYLARGGGAASQRDYLSRGGTQTLGGAVKVETVTALRSTPQWLAATTSSLASTPSVGITSLSMGFNIVTSIGFYTLTLPNYICRASNGGKFQVFIFYLSQPDLNQKSISDIKAFFEANQGPILKSMK